MTLMPWRIALKSPETQLWKMISQDGECVRLAIPVDRRDSESESRAESHAHVCATAQNTQAEICSHSCWNTIEGSSSLPHHALPRCNGSGNCEGGPKASPGQSRRSGKSFLFYLKAFPGGEKNGTLPWISWKGSRVFIARASLGKRCEMRKSKQPLTYLSVPAQAGRGPNCSACSALLGEAVKAALLPWDTMQGRLVRRQGKHTYQKRVGEEWKMKVSWASYVKLQEKGMERTRNSGTLLCDPI